MHTVESSLSHLIHIKVLKMKKKKAIYREVNISEVASIRTQLFISTHILGYFLWLIYITKLIICKIYRFALFEKGKM